MKARSVALVISVGMIVVGLTGRVGWCSWWSSADASMLTEAAAPVLTEQAKLLASDGAGNDRFGLSVAVAGDVAVIGADTDDDNGPASGSAYVFLPTLAFADGFESGDTSAWNGEVQ